MRRAVLAAVATVAVLAGGCMPSGGGDPPGPTGSADSPSPSSASPDAPPSDTGGPTPVATRRIVTDLATIRVPRPYRVRALLFTTSASPPDLEATVSISVTTDLPDRGVDFRADLGADSPLWRSRPRRLPDIVVDGVVCYHLRGRLTSGQPTDEYGGYWDGRAVWVSVASNQAPAQRRELNRLVLDSWTWR